MGARFELAKTVIAQLRKKQLFLVPTESCTGGALCDAITNVPGASDVLANGFVVYSNGAKLKLGVAREVIEENTVYSLETATEMARAGLKRADRGDIGVGITGNLPGTVYIAVLWAERVSTKVLELRETDRRKSKAEIVESALRMILDLI